MSFTAYYQNLRQAPEIKRRRVAFVSSLALTALIAVGWLINMGVLFPPRVESVQVAAVNAVEESGDSVLTEISDRIGKGWQMLTDLF